ncbi:hypothetical protein KEJ50_01460 [Candidatus Bathyarchaeota archaeon]|nr:hypothetical protein [Candidatus Bathyarchaeota archaeon]
MVLNKSSIKEFKRLNEKLLKLNFNNCVDCKPVKANISLGSFKFIEAPPRPRRLRRPFKIIKKVFRNEN